MLARFVICKEYFTYIQFYNSVLRLQLMSSVKNSWWFISMEKLRDTVLCSLYQIQILLPCCTPCFLSTDTAHCFMSSYNYPVRKHKTIWFLRFYTLSFNTVLIGEKPLRISENFILCFLKLTFMLCLCCAFCEGP